MYLLQEKPDIKDITRRKSSPHVFLITKNHISARLVRIWKCEKSLISLHSKQIDMGREEDNRALLEFYAPIEDQMQNIIKVIGVGR